LQLPLSSAIVLIMNQNNDDERVNINLSSIYRINDDVKQCIISAIHYYLQLPVPEMTKILGNQALRSFNLPIPSSIESKTENTPNNDITTANNKNTLELIKKLIDKAAEQTKCDNDKLLLITLESQIKTLLG